MKIDIEDFESDDFGLEIGHEEEMDSDSEAVKKYRPHLKTTEKVSVKYKNILKNRKNRLVLIDFSIDKNELIFFFETRDYHFGRCLVISDESNSDSECCICSGGIKENEKVYIPYAWDVKLSHFGICPECYWSSFQSWING